jgi:hypothetical protein
MPRTAARLSPSPVVSSRSTRMGTGSSNLTATLSGAGSGRSSSPGRIPVASSQVPLQSS